MKTYLIAVLILVVGVFAGGIYAYVFFDAPSGVGEGSGASMAEKSSDVSGEVGEVLHAEEKTREYRNATRGFSLRYPRELSIKEYDEGEGTYTIVFEDATDEKSFQVFFTPYLGDAITQSRILKDVPSGKFTAPIEIVIGGGTRALAFFSTGPLGEMREVWFIRDGFLYEVTAYKSLDEWLAGIMQTWRFFKN